LKQFEEQSVSLYLPADISEPFWQQIVSYFEKHGGGRSGLKSRSMLSADAANGWLNWSCG